MRLMIYVRFLGANTLRTRTDDSATGTWKRRDKSYVTYHHDNARTSALHDAPDLDSGVRVYMIRNANIGSMIPNS